MTNLKGSCVMSADWLEWCRLCGGSQDVCIPLCRTGGVNDSFDVLENVNKYLNANISVGNCNNDERFPQNVCKSCVQFLQQIDSFAMQCAKVQAMFYSLSAKPIIERRTSVPEQEEEEIIKQNLYDTKECNLPCNYEERSYETVPIEPCESESKQSNRGRGACKRKGKTGIQGQIRGRGRPRKCDKIVPRIRIRAIRPRVCNDAVDSSGNLDTQEKKNAGCIASNGDGEQIIQQSRPVENIKVELLHDILTDVEEDAENNKTGDSVKNACSSKAKEKSANNGNHKKLKTSELKALVPSLYHFKCHVCELVCKNWNSLRIHCKDIHGENAQITCDCRRVLTTRAGIVEHRARHTDGDVYKCDKCEKTFHRKSLFNVHMMSHVPKEEQPFVCCKCARRFHCEALLRNHERVHLPKEERLVFPCHLCQKMFSSKSAVAAHLKAIHLGERPFVCDQCGHCFTSKGILQEHLTIHSDDAPWNCSKCNKNFKTKYRLKIHMDTHRETPYQCPKCPVLLSTRRTLRMHLVVHRDTKAYQCSICGKAFRRAKDLKNHNNLHTGRRPYTCPFCLRTFANGSNCRSHKRRRHPDELKMFESSLAGNGLVDNVQRISPEGESKANEIDLVDESDVKDDRKGVHFNSEQVSEMCVINEKKTTSAVIAAGSSSSSGYASSFFSFASTNDRRYSPIRHSAGFLRSTFNQHLSEDQVSHQYSPCHEHDVSSSAVPAFPGNPYVHQSFLFNRSIEPS